MESLISVRGTKAQTHISYAIFAAGIYYLWRARNMVIFRNKKPPSNQILHLIKEQIRNRILFLNINSQRFNMYVDRLLL